jgi:hypothetical protein
VPREQWEQMSRFQKNCWRWMRINRIIEGHVEWSRSTRAISAARKLAQQAKSNRPVAKYCGTIVWI